MSFSICFTIIIMIDTADVLSEDVILKWYKEPHASRGKSTFIEQMKKFVEWLNNAEEGNYPFNVIIALTNRMFSLESEDDE